MKFLQKFDIRIYIFVLFTVFTFFITLNVNAIQNFDTQYNITIPNYDDIYKDIYCGNESIKDFLHNFIDNFNNSNSLYNIIILPKARIGQTSLSDNSLTFFTYKKNNSTYNRVSFFGSSTKFYNYYLYSTNSNHLDDYSYQIKLNTCDSSISTSTSFQKYLDYIYGNYSPNNYGSRTDEDNQGFMLTGGWGIRGYKLNYDDNQSFNNTDNFTLNEVNWYYWSNRALNYKAIDTTNYNATGFFFKKLHITNNDITYNYLDDLISFYDIKDTFPTSPTFIGYKTSLDTFYTSLNVNDFNNYSLSINFKVPFSLLGYSQEPLEYINNTNFNYICSGRINNSNYYSYESFPCSLTSSYTINNYDITYTFNNLSTSNILTNYDKIYVTIDSNYLDNELNTVVYNLNYVYTLGSFYNTIYKGSIYENFTNLPLNFRLYLSSNNSLVYSNVFVKKYNFLNYGINYGGFSNTNNKQNLIVGKSILGIVNSNDIDNDFIQFEVSNDIDTGIMIYQKNSSLILPDLHLFFNSGLFISFNNNLSNNIFYYIDNNGDIVNNDILINNNDNVSNKYDISYYVGVVNNFINELSSDTLEFSTLTQTFYNGLPLFFQTFIFVVFILLCIYFTYLLIKR